MKKTIVCLVSFLLIFSMLLTSACRSRLKEGIERDRLRYVVNEFDLAAACTEEDGYHFPGVSWGADVASLQQSHGVTVSSVMGYSENNIVAYNASQLRVRMLNRLSDDATVAAVSDEIYMISFVFNSDGVGVSEVSQSTLRDTYVQKLTDTYGEPSKHEKTEKNVNDVRSYYETWYWDKETSDGKKTQLQFATSSAIPGGEPSYVSMGVVWLRDELTSETSEEDGTEESGE